MPFKTWTAALKHITPSPHLVLKDKHISPSNSRFFQGKRYREMLLAEISWPHLRYCLAAHPPQYVSQT